MSKGVDLRFFRVYNQEIALFLFGLGMIFYALGLDEVAYRDIKPQSFFLLGGVLFILCNVKAIKKADLKALIIPAITFATVLVMGLLTYFDDILEYSLSHTLKSANTHILKYFILFFLCYVFALHARLNLALAFLALFVILCMAHVVANVYLGDKNGLLSYNVPFFFNAVFTYNIWILAPLALSLSMFLKNGVIWKIIAFLLFCLSVIAMLSNSERSFVVACVVMVFASLFLYPYKHKLRGIVAIFFICAFGILSAYQFSKNLPPRWNVAHMVDNFHTVWHTNPIEMGKYDRACFDKTISYISCYEESTAFGRSDIVWEHSSLSRIAMSKSTLLAFLDKPLFPRLIDVFDIGKYLYKYYEEANHQNRVFIIYKGKDINGYNNPHNHAISLLFAYGLIGFASIIVFIAYMLGVCYQKMRHSYSPTQRFVATFLCLLIVGICVQSVFDVYYPFILQIVFIVFGTSLGFLRRNIAL